MGDTPRYRAFISYSQADKVEVKRLQRWLEIYRVPKSIPAGNLTSGRLGRFFRDDEDMSAASDIGSLVREAIERSDALIVACSPRSAKSKWVDAEIRHFRATGRTRQIFAVILDGVPNSGDPETECFPPSFRRGGDPDDPATMPVEPLAIDLRVEGRERAQARLAAGLLGVAFDVLWQRERRRQRQRIALGGGLIALGLALTVVATISGWFALRQLEIAERQTALTLQQSSNVIARESEAIFKEESGDHTTSLLMALYADPAGRDPAIPRRYVPRDGYAFARARLIAHDEAR